LNIATESAGRFAFWLPNRRFPNGWIDALRHAAALFHLEPVARNGLSLARNGSRFHEIHSGVKGPGLLLRSLAYRFLRPFSLNLRYRTRFAPVPAASSTHTRCATCDPRA
jgi:hypothetical protein